MYCRKRCSQISEESTCIGVIFLNKVAGQRAFNFILKKFQRSYFPVKFATFLRTPIFKDICEQLLPCLHTILFTGHEKYTAKNAPLEPS